MPYQVTDETLEYHVEHYSSALMDTIRLCLRDMDASIDSCNVATMHDLDLIWSWNEFVPETYNICLHDRISQKAQSMPDKVAISSWDGDLTYDQVDKYSSHVTYLLQQAGVQPDTFVPICFEKSKWTIIAVLATMKIGATFVLMDPTLPLARLQSMVTQTQATVMLASEIQRELAPLIIGNGTHMIIDVGTFDSAGSLQFPTYLPIVASSTLMYLIFTSGSTGTPKGVKISHQAYASSAVPRSKAVGYTENSRVLDFASYAFDVSIDSMLLTLSNGGCLCIPSDEDRLSDINGAMRKMKVNYAGLTPSVARVLDLEVIKALDALGLGGEAASARDIARWGEHTRIVIGYGPCECTIGCSVNSDAATGRDYSTIGPGNGAVLWLTDPNNHNSLVPVGAVGEILVEGPIVGQGYLNDPEKTTTAFIHDPTWLLSGHRGCPGRGGCLYKTGDLGRYDPAGSGEIVFVGRKDTQIKLRGQRIELEEIESHLKTKLPSQVGVVAEVILPEASGGHPTLVVFIALLDSKRQKNQVLETTKLPTDLEDRLSDAHTYLQTAIPRYMIPTAYITVSDIPSLISGKTDRKQLRNFGKTINLQAINGEEKLMSDKTNTRQLTEIESSLQGAWAVALNISQDSIQIDSNFFAIGGDSLTSMKLVSISRLKGLGLTVSKIFMNPLLESMSKVVEVLNPSAQEELPPFSLTPKPITACRMEASHACNIDWESIEDIYPSTPTQESLFTFSHRSQESYIAQRIATIPSNITLESWQLAWEKVVAETPILRTRLVQLVDPTPLQVVVKESINWKYSSNLHDYLEEDRSDKMNFGQSLARYAIITLPDDGSSFMIWTVHHVLYDGWSEPLILSNIKKALQNESINISTPMKDFIQYLGSVDNAATRTYWDDELHGAVGPQFPHLPSRDFLATPSSVLDISVNLPQPITAFLFTPATVIRAAWALVASQYTGSSDVVFGETLTGRDVALAGVETLIGPLIATIPMRIRIDRKCTVQTYLEYVSGIVHSRIDHQHFGMQNIRKVSQDAQFACEAGTGIVIQPEPDYDGKDLGFESGDVLKEALNFNPYPLMLAFGIREKSLRVCASFDNTIIDELQMKQAIYQFEKACSELMQETQRTVGQIDCVPDAELDQIWHWNQQPPLVFDKTLGTFRADSCITSGSLYPRAYVSWVCNPQNHELLSPIGCPGELWLEGAGFGLESISNPTWLKAGSPKFPGRNGMLSPTGDVVKMREDGTLEFIGRKEDILSIDGHVINIPSLEMQCQKFLPLTTNFTCGIREQPSGTPSLLVFFEEETVGVDGIPILQENNIVPLDSNISATNGTVPVLRKSVSQDTVALLRKLHTFLQNNFPAHMVPLAYVPTENIGPKSSRPSRSFINKLADAIPSQTIAQIIQAVEKAWETVTTPSNLTPSEEILQLAWSYVLGIPKKKIGVKDNFFRLGGDSVLAMKLVAMLRNDGHTLTVAEIFRHMQLGKAAQVLKTGEGQLLKLQRPKPYSLLSGLNSSISEFLEGLVYPKLSDPKWIIQDVIPVTDSQIVDIEATIHARRTSMQYVALYPDFVIDQQRLADTCKAWVNAHDILRTVFISGESNYLQVVLKELEVPIVRQTGIQDMSAAVADVCARDVETEMPLGSSFLKIRLVEDDNHKQCLILGVSHAQYDGISLPALLRNFEALYAEKSVPSTENFPSYMGWVLNQEVQSPSIKYWKILLAESSISVLPGMTKDPRAKSVFISKPTNFNCTIEDITAATLLSTAWGLVLSRRLGINDVTFGSITSGRAAADFEGIIGPCYQFTPVRITLNPSQSMKELLKDVQEQGAESMAHDHVGFRTISQNCTQWPSSVQFFDSIVHHQDFEDFDSMPFANGSCRVETLNPHGDSAYPLKVVSYFRSNQYHFGLVGSEQDAEEVEKLLDEVIKAVQELTI